MSTTFNLNEMRDRLKTALIERGISYRKASLDAGIGESYVSGIIKEGKDPQVSYLARVCATAGISLSWVLYGIDINQEDEDLIAIIQDHPEKRDLILALLQAK